MRTGRIRKWVVAAVSASAVGAPAVAQPPAARLQPIDPDKLPAPPIARSAYPDIPDANIQQVPVQGYAGQPQPERSRTWIGGAWAGVKEFVVGPPTPPAPQPAPMPSQAPVPQAGRPPMPRQGQPTPGQPAPPAAPVPQAQQPPVPPQPGIYAGPPAYRWYGWGSTTPGINQYAPHGLYPKGSAAWHAHTGATPGAFPVPVQYPSATPGVEPPAYANNPQPYDASYVAPARATRPDPLPTYDPRGGTGESVARPPVGRPMIEPPPGFPSSPSLPAGVPVSVEPRQPDVNWQTVRPGSGALPTVSPGGMPSAPRPQSPSAPADPQWVPVSGPGTYPGTTVPTGAGANRPSSGITLVRGQEPVAAKPTDINALIRETCFSRVSQVRIVETGPRKLTVTFVTSTEQLAREAAALVSELPELRPYEVRFEVQLSK